jgi:hypothetical protein
MAITILISEYEFLIYLHPGDFLWTKYVRSILFDIVNDCVLSLKADWNKNWPCGVLQTFFHDLEGAAFKWVFVTKQFLQLELDSKEVCHDCYIGNDNISTLCSESRLIGHWYYCQQLPVKALCHLLRKMLPRARTASTHCLFLLLIINQI